MKELFRLGVFLAAGCVGAMARADDSGPLTPVQRESAKAAQAAFDRGDLTAAEKAFLQLSQEAPQSVYALSNLGVVQFRLGKLNHAAQSFAKAIRLDPNDAFSQRTLGIIYYSQTRYDDAARALKKAIELNPKDAQAHNFLALVALGNKQPEVAKQEQEAAEALDPSLKTPPEHPPGKLGDFLTPLKLKQRGGLEVRPQ